jgi:hypothetical protein
MHFSGGLCKRQGLFHSSTFSGTSGASEQLELELLELLLDGHSSSLRPSRASGMGAGPFRPCTSGTTYSKSLFFLGLSNWTHGKFGYKIFQLLAIFKSCPFVPGKRRFLTAVVCRLSRAHVRSVAPWEPRSAARCRAIHFKGNDGCKTSQNCLTVSWSESCGGYSTAANGPVFWRKWFKSPCASRISACQEGIPRMHFLRAKKSTRAGYREKRIYSVRMNPLIVFDQEQCRHAHIGFDIAVGRTYSKCSPTMRLVLARTPRDGHFKRSHVGVTSWPAPKRACALSSDKASSPTMLETLKSLQNQFPS